MELTCETVIKPLEGTLGFLKSFGHTGPEAKSDTQGQRESYWHGQEESTFPHSTVLHCASGSAGPPRPDVTLEGLSNAPYPQSFLPLPHVEKGVSGAHSL